MMTTFPPRVLSSGILFTAYQYIHSHHCLYPLAWDSTSTWILAAIGIDFCYYWVHRAAHGRSLLVHCNQLVEFDGEEVE